MKKTTCAVLAILFCIAALILAACSSPARPGEDTTGSEESQLEEKFEELVFTPLEGNSFSITGGYTTAELRADRNGVAVRSLKNQENGYEWLASETVQEMPELKKYRKETEETTFDWTFAGAYENTSTTFGYTLKFVFENTDPAFRVESVWNVCGDFSPIQHTMYVFNLSDEAYTVYSRQSVSLRIKNELDLIAWRFHKESFTADSVGLYRHVLRQEPEVAAQTTMVVDTDNNSGFIPILYFDAAGTQGLYVGWEWCHGRVKAVPAAKSTAIVESGFNDDFKTVIRPRTRFLIPTAYIGTYTGDLDDGTNRFNRWFYRNKTKKSVHGDENEPLTQMGYVDYDYEEMGIESIQWDYGWWGSENGEGVWELHHPVLESVVRHTGAVNIRTFADKLRDKGVGFTLYILLHDALNPDGTVNPAEKIFNSRVHPDWFSSRFASANASADLGNEKCLAYVKEKLAAFLTDNHIRTWRVDMEPVPWDSAWDNRHVFGQLDTTYWNAVGYYEIVDYLFDNVEGFRNEVCGSGGAYKDYATLTRTTVMQTDDRANYNSARQIFYTTSYGVPPALLLHVVNYDSFMKGTSLYTGPADIDYGLRSVILACPMMDGSKTNWKLDAKLARGVKKYYNYYNDYIANYQKNGYLYHILPRPDFEHWDGVEYYWDDSPLAYDGVVFLFKPTNKEGNEKTIVWKGLDPDAVYSLVFEDRKEQNCEMKGSELMENGLKVTITGNFGSEMIWIKKQGTGNRE